MVSNEIWKGSNDGSVLVQLLCVVRRIHTFGNAMNVMRRSIGASSIEETDYKQIGHGAEPRHKPISISPNFSIPVANGGKRRGREWR